MESFTLDSSRLLTAAGRRFLRSGRGDHEIWFSPVTQVHFVVDGKPESRHTANAVLRQAGLPKGF